MPHRLEKINDLIRDTIAQIIVKHLSLKKDVFVSVTNVDTSKDLRYARVFVSVFPVEHKDYIEKTFARETYHIQGILNKTLRMKPLPRLEFIIDETQQKLGELDEIFEQIRKERE